MNDFTREELSEIRGILITYGVQGEDLELKVKSMVDNYCNHDWNGIRYAAVRLRSTDDRYYQYKCSKCDKVLFEY